MLERVDISKSALLIIHKLTTMVHAYHTPAVFAGESWWETDLLAVAKDYLANVPAADSSGTSLSATPLPPLGVREWLVQEQVRSWLVAIFSRADPLKLMEVDLVMQMGKVRNGLLRWSPRTAGWNASDVFSSHPRRVKRLTSRWLYSRAR